MRYLIAISGVLLATTLNSALALSPPQPISPIWKRIDVATQVVVGTPKRVVYLDSRDRILEDANEKASPGQRIALQVLVHHIDYSNAPRSDLVKGQSIVVSLASVGGMKPSTLEQMIGNRLGILIRSYERNLDGRVVRAFDAVTAPLVLDSDDWREVQRAINDRQRARAQPALDAINAK